MPRGEVRDSAPGKLRAHREAKDYSLDLLADLAGMSSRTLWGWEAGRRRPTAPLLAAVADVLDVSIHDLIDRDRTRLRDLRQDANLTRDEVCKALHLYPVTVNQIERRAADHSTTRTSNTSPPSTKSPPSRSGSRRRKSAADWQAVLDKPANSETPPDRSRGVSLVPVEPAG